MMLEHKVPSLMAEKNESTVMPTATKPLVKSLPQANGCHYVTPFENGTPDLNGTASNGVH